MASLKRKGVSSIRFIVGYKNHLVLKTLNYNLLIINVLILFLYTLTLDFVIFFQYLIQTVKRLKRFESTLSTISIEQFVSPKSLRRF